MEIASFPSFFPRFVGLLAAFLLCLAPLRAEDLNAVLYRTQGKVEVLPGARPNANWKAARAGMGLREKDKLRTGSNSSAQILLDDGSFFHLKAAAEFEIEALVRNRKTRAQQSSLKVWKGTLLGRVEKLEKGSRADFRSPTALVAVRGTELGVDVDEQGATDIALFEGRIVVSDFAEERMIPREQDELLLELLHEVSLKADQLTRVTKQGVSRPRKLDGKAQEWRKELPTLRAEQQQAAQDQAKISPEQAQTERARLRQQVLE